MVESPTAEACNASAEQSDPKLPGFRINIEGGNYTPGKTVLFPPVLNFTGFLVNTNQSIFGTTPNPFPVNLNSENMVIRKTIFHRKMFPFRINIRKFLLSLGRSNIRNSRLAHYGIPDFTERCFPRSQYHQDFQYYYDILHK